MQAVTPCILTDHTGVERELRFTPGARKRIAERLGTENILEIAKDKGDWALYEVAYCLMYDRNGQPPANLSLDEWMEGTSGSDAQEIATAILSAVTQGKTPKNEIAEMLTAAQTGFPSGPTVPSVSDLPTESSGGSTPLENSTPE